METKTKILTAIGIIGILSIATLVYANMPNVIDKMEDQKIIYQTEQKQLQDVNYILKVEREALDKKITENSNQWHNLNGKIQQIDLTIKAIQNEELGE